MLSVEQVRVNMGELIEKKFGADALNKEQHAKDVQALELRKAKDELAELERKAKELEAAKETKPVQEPAKEVEVTKVVETTTTTVTETAPVVENTTDKPAKETAAPVSELDEINAKIAEVNKMVADKEREKKKDEMIEYMKTKTLALFDMLNNEYSNKDIVAGCASVANLDKMTSEFSFDKSFDETSLDEFKAIIDPYFAEIEKVVPVITLVKIPFDLTGLIERIKLIKTLEDLYAVKEMFEGLSELFDFSVDVTAEDFVARKFTEEEIKAIETHMAPFVEAIEEKKEQKTQEALEEKVSIERAISLLMTMYPNAIRAEHNHESEFNNTMYVATNSSNTLTLIPLKDKDGKFTKVKTVISPLEIAEDGSIIPFSFVKDHHTEVFETNYILIEAITGFITNTGGFRTNSKDNSITIERVKK